MVCQRASQSSGRAQCTSGQRGADWANSTAAWLRGEHLADDLAPAGLAPQHARVVKPVGNWGTCEPHTPPPPPPPPPPTPPPPPPPAPPRLPSGYRPPPGRLPGLCPAILWAPRLRRPAPPPPPPPPGRGEGPVCGAAASGTARQRRDGDRSAGAGVNVGASVRTAREKPRTGKGS